MIIGETPPNVPGPPPHFHKGLNEAFLVLEGEMEFMVNGEIKNVLPGDSVDLPPHVVHTFSNKGDRPCKWINIHSPKGYRSFFEDVGVSANETDAIANFVDHAIIEKVMCVAADYDMHIKM